MAKWAHSDVLDGGLLALQNGATTQLLLSSYTAGASYAAVQANKLAQVTVAPSNFTLSSSGSDRVLTAAAASSTASASATGSPDLHIAFTNGVDKVLWVTDETTNQAIAQGNPVNFPPVTCTFKQPA